MNYRTLFDTETIEPPIARASDPQTSHDAAAETKLNLKKHKAYCVSVMQGKLGPRTAQEIAAEAANRFGGIPETYRKRPHELVCDGLFEECGFRKCTVTGKNAQTFRAKGQQ